MNGEIALRNDEAIELGELLDFLSGWIGFHDRRATESLNAFTYSGYTVDELRAGLARFAFPLAGDGEHFVHGASR